MSARAGRRAVNYGTILAKTSVTGEVKCLIHQGPAYHTAGGNTCGKCYGREAVATHHDIACRHVLRTDRARSSSQRERRFRPYDAGGVAADQGTAVIRQHAVSGSLHCMVIDTTPIAKSGTVGVMRAVLQVSFNAAGETLKDSVSHRPLSTALVDVDKIVGFPPDDEAATNITGRLTLHGGALTITAAEEPLT